MFEKKFHNKDFIMKFDTLRLGFNIARCTYFSFILYPSLNYIILYDILVSLRKRIKKFQYGTVQINYVNLGTPAQLNFVILTNRFTSTNQIINVNSQEKISECVSFRSKYISDPYL